SRAISIVVGDISSTENINTEIQFFQYQVACRFWHWLAQHDIPRYFNKLLDWSFPQHNPFIHVTIAISRTWQLILRFGFPLTSILHVVPNTISGCEHEQSYRSTADMFASTIIAPDSTSIS